MERALVMRADKVGADTMLSRIVAMAAEAQRNSARHRSQHRSGLAVYAFSARFMDAMRDAL